MADKYVPIFFDWPEATQELNAQEKGRLIDAIVLYARGGDWSELLKGNERYVFPMFQLQIDRAKQISSVRTTARKNKTEQNEQNTTNRTKRNKTSNNNKNKEEYKNKDEEENKKESEDTPRAKTRFTPPTLDEVLAYANEKGYSEKEFSAERFIDFYSSKGWKVGKETMKDWQAAARGWVSRYRQEHPKSKPRNYDNSDLDWIFGEGD